MLKKTITYNDLDGNKVTEDFYFNLNKAEIAELELEKKGGLSAYLQQIVQSEDQAEIIGVFKHLISKSVGRRSEDGKRFIKNQDIIDEFIQTEAYSELFMEMLSDADAASGFMRGIVPSDLAENIKDVELPEEEPLWMKENREPTPAEINNMSQAELQKAFLWKQQKAAVTDQDI